MDHEQHPSQYACALKRPAAPVNTWVQLAKPGIVMGNVIAVLGGFMFGSAGQGLDAGRLAATVLGTALVVGSGCVINNCIDRDIDRCMARTCHRALANRAFMLKTARLYGAALGVAGLALLLTCSGLLASAMAGIGWVIYVVFYSLWLKRRSHWGIVIGSLSGAMPPAIGYCAARGEVDDSVALLIILYCLWQMAHSHAIALYRRDDVRAARLPALPPDTATVHINLYVLAFLGCAWVLGISAHLNAAYFLLLGGFGGYWTWVAASGWRSRGQALWARKVFRVSLTTIIALNVGLCIGAQG